jgi:hypothetical protein
LDLFLRIIVVGEENKKERKNKNKGRTAPKGFYGLEGLI